MNLYQYLAIALTILAFISYFTWILLRKYTKNEEQSGKNPQETKNTNSINIHNEREEVSRSERVSVKNKFNNFKKTFNKENDDSAEKEKGDEGHKSFFEKYILGWKRYLFNK